MGKVIMVNIEKCLACKSCELACAVAHSKSGVLEEAIAQSPRPQKRINVEAVEDFAVPMQCRHCEDAPCIQVCPTRAIYRQSIESPVLINPELCIGCKFCLMVCPMGVIDVSRDGKAMTKCDLCINRPGPGEGPACVEACPTKALQLVSDGQLIAANRKLAAEKLVLSTQENRTKRKQKKSK